MLKLIYHAIHKRIDQITHQLPHLITKIASQIQERAPVSESIC